MTSSQEVGTRFATEEVEAEALAVVGVVGVGGVASVDNVVSSVQGLNLAELAVDFFLPIKLKSEGSCSGLPLDRVVIFLVGGGGFFFVFFLLFCWVKGGVSLCGGEVMRVEV